jgi:hypothetical protein
MPIARVAGPLAWAIVGLVAFAGAAIGQPQSPSASAGRKLTLDGDWRINFTMSMEAPPGASALIVSEQEAKVVAAQVGKALSDDFAAQLDPELPLTMLQSDGLPIVRGQRRTRVVVQPADGKLPYTAAARKELADPPPPEVFDNPENRPNAERCLVGQGQPPFEQFSLDNQIQIVRTHDAVVIHVEYGDDLRVVPLTDKHAPKALWSRLGDSIGHWEGKTLVIETVGMPDGDRMRLAPTLIVPGEATVIERLTPISDRELLYQFTIIAPRTYAGPWLGEFSWFRTDKPMYEHACHEGNHSLPNILAGARYDEAVVKAAAGR